MVPGNKFREKIAHKKVPRKSIGQKIKVTHEIYEVSAKKKVRKASRVTEQANELPVSKNVMKPQEQ